ncbi:membrane protein involved in colicin uptake [Rhodococcus ruber]|uniref:capsid assembly scaffolding protein Gp46 family protein n=1 Tax=Rhodococcus ruber TaxID=1830 RepID=UPI001AE5FA3C|nr:DUF4355 domain-containing protein [Rhodococcus ruber]MBP2211091.1 membrane protein involved in colicin uptake [Rhodococcus ruber]
MSDDQSPKPVAEADEKPLEGDAPQPEVFDAEYVAKLRKEAAKYRTDAKANAEAAKKLAELEEAQKSEAQKQAERLEAAEKRATELELKAARAEIASTVGIPADILSGPEDNTADAIQAYAEKVIAWRDSTAPTPPPTGVHVPGEGKAPSTASLDDQIAEATKAGNLALAIHLKRQKAQTR